MSVDPHPDLAARLLAEIKLTPDAGFAQVFAALMGCAAATLNAEIRRRGAASLPDARNLADAVTPMLHEMLDEIVPPQHRSTPNWNGA